MTTERKTGVTGTPDHNKIAEPSAPYAVPTLPLPERAANAWHPAQEQETTPANLFAQLMSKATAVLGSADEALRWVAQPALALDGHAPLALLNHTAGFEQVNDCLSRMEYGVYQ